ncbi:MAG: efflux RND transporter periplasmic adaptor subunit [Rubrivivax sp.]
MNRPGPLPARPLLAARCVLAAAGALLLASCGRAPAPVEPVRAVRVEVVGSAAGPTGQEYAAEVRARVESRLAFRVGGKLVERQADAGQAVRAGQVLARLDPQDLKLGQEAARAALASARAQLEVAESEYRRFVTLRDQGFISGAELERREAGVKSARAAAEQAEAQLRVQANQSGYAALTADVSGVVTAVEAEPGMVLAAGTPVLRLAHDGPREAWFAVPEDRAEAMRALQGRAGRLQVRLWGEEARTWPATVREIAAAADPTTRTFLVKADLGRAPVRLGQTATVSVPVAEAASAPAAGRAFTLPLTAVFEQRGASTVWVLDRSQMLVQPRAVKVAGAQGNRIVVAGGLQPGETVVTAGVHTLSPGQKVTLYTEPGTAAHPAKLDKAAK